MAPSCFSYSRGMNLRGFLLLPLVLFLSACAGLPVAQNGQWQPSPNFDARRPNFVILHQTTNATVERALQTLTDPARKVSAHYLIGRDGSVIQLVDETQRAWHAGESWWGGNTDLNSSSIGIELDNTGEEPFADAQIDALLGLLANLQQRYRIPAANILAHGDIAPRRKVDPSRYFPWERLAAAGFGLWCAAPDSLPAGRLDPQLGLQALGYDIRDPEAARRAFRRHFLAEDNSADWRSADLALLACLLRKKQATPQQPQSESM